MAQITQPRGRGAAAADTTTKSNEMTKALGKIAPYAAVLAMGVWTVALWILYNRVGDPQEIQWARLMVIFGSIQGVAFGAFGALFGATIQIQRVEKAETEAATAKGEADLGKQVAAAVKGEASAMLVGKKFGLTDDAITLMDQKESLRLARKLLPDN